MHIAAEPDPTLIRPSTDPVLLSMTVEELRKLADATNVAMQRAAKKMDFMEAAHLRDEYFAIENLIEVRG